jgi:hypothetical protein
MADEPATPERPPLAPLPGRPAAPDVAPLIGRTVGVEQVILGVRATAAGFQERK